MNYDDIDQEKANDQRPTTIVIDCTFGEKYRFVQAAKKEKKKLVHWAIEAMIEKVEKKGKGFEIN